MRHLLVLVPALLSASLLSGCVAISPNLSPDVLPQGAVAVSASAGTVGLGERPASSFDHTSPFTRLPLRAAAVRYGWSREADVGADLIRVPGGTSTSWLWRASLRKRAGLGDAPVADVVTAAVVFDRTGRDTLGYAVVTAGRAYGARLSPTLLAYLGGYAMVDTHVAFGAGAHAGVEAKTGPLFLRAEGGARFWIVGVLSTDALVTAGVRF